MYKLVCREAIKKITIEYVFHEAGRQAGAAHTVIRVFKTRKYAEYFQLLKFFFLITLYHSIKAFIQNYPNIQEQHTFIISQHSPTHHNVSLDTSILNNVSQNILRYKTILILTNEKPNIKTELMFSIYVEHTKNPVVKKWLAFKRIKKRLPFDLICTAT